MAKWQLKFSPFARLMRLDKPVGSLLLLWPTLWALVLAAGGLPKLSTLIVFVAGVFLMRAAGCVINDIADRHVDGLVKRTNLRPLATGELTLKQAVVCLLVLVSLAASLLFFLKLKTVYLALFAGVLAGIYPFTKRFFDCPQLILGLAFAFAIPMAFAEITNALPALCWWLFAATVCWVIAYDTQYAMVDRDDDTHAGIRSSALLFGRLDCLMIGLLHVLMTLLWVLIGLFLSFGIPFYLLLTLATLTLVYQHYLIRTRLPAACFQAFLNNQWYGFLMTIGLLLSL